MDSRVYIGLSPAKNLGFSTVGHDSQSTEIKTLPIGSLVVVPFWGCLIGF